MNMALNDAIDIDFLNQVIGNDTEFEKELYEIFKENFEHNFLKLTTIYRYIKKKQNLYHDQNVALFPIKLVFLFTIIFKSKSVYKYESSPSDKSEFSL